MSTRSASVAKIADDDMRRMVEAGMAAYTHVPVASHEARIRRVVKTIIEMSGGDTPSNSSARAALVDYDRAALGRSFGSTE